jgi:deoxyribonuclease V
VSAAAVPPDWIEPPDLKAASEIQRRMAERLVLEDDLGPVRVLAGADVSAERFDPLRRAYAAIVTLSAEGLHPLAVGTAAGRARFPYVPGFLGFREVPFLLQAAATLPALPDLVFVDGQGVAHPRGVGLASQLGIVLGRPTIGVAKTILVGEPAGPLGPEVGDRVPLIWQGRTVAMALRTRRGSRPLYVSIGHRVGLDTAVDWVLRSGAGYRLPEPTRLAHLESNALRRRVRDSIT